MLRRGSANGARDIADILKVIGLKGRSGISP